MQTYIALLRGINVSGKNIIKMQDLLQMFVSLGFQNVKTYIQSGNVVFQAQKENFLYQKISQAILEKFQLQIEVLVLEKEELTQILQQNPFQDKEEKSMYFTVFRGEINTDSVVELNAKKHENEEFSISKNVLYCYFGNGYANTKLNNNFIENKLKVIATTRNFNTMKTLLEWSNSL